MTEATSLLPLLFLLDANRAVGGDFVGEVGGAYRFRKRRILLENVEDVGVFRRVAEHVRVKSGDDFPAFRRGSFDDGFVQLALFQNLLAVGGNQIANIPAE